MIVKINNIFMNPPGLITKTIRETSCLRIESYATYIVF